MKAIKRILFGGDGASTATGDVGLALYRIAIGLGIAIGHGFGKVYSDGALGPSQGFIDATGKLGFPAPTLFAWMAALTEFVGGLLLALGLMTRPVAAALTFNMFIAAFLAMRSAPLWGPQAPNKEFALLYFLGFALLMFTGGGQYSLDAMLKRR